jgi:hypothetical protein
LGEKVEDQVKKGTKIGGQNNRRPSTARQGQRDIERHIGTEAQRHRDRRPGEDLPQAGTLALGH